MDLTHSFTVPLSIDETWGHFNDIASVAECFPGAQVTEFDGNSFTGSCKVKLGPIAMVYSGTGTFLEKDEAARKFVIDAKGKDKRGNGTAGAHVTLTMAEVAEGTEVTVVTDLAITGKPAQFGRGVMQDVSDKLLGQFVACLEERFVEKPEEEAAPTPAGAAPEAAVPAEAAGAPAAGPAATEPAAAAASGGTPGPGATPIVGAAGGTSAAPRPAGGARKAPASDDALDLGATVLPILLKSYWKQIAGAVVVLLILRRLLRRRS